MTPECISSKEKRRSNVSTSDAWAVYRLTCIVAQRNTNLFDLPSDQNKNAFGVEGLWQQKGAGEGNAWPPASTTSACLARARIDARCLWSCFYANLLNPEPDILSCSRLWSSSCPGAVRETRGKTEPAQRNEPQHALKRFSAIGFGHESHVWQLSLLFFFLSFI